MTKLLSQRVTLILSETGMGQLQLSKASGASKSVVSQWISGAIKTMNPKYAFRIEKTTGYKAEWLMLGQGDKKNSQAASSHWASLEINPSSAIKTYRQKKGMTHADLAAAMPANARCTRQAIMKWESHGAHKISLHYLVGISQALNVGIGELLTPTDSDTFVSQADKTDGPASHLSKLTPDIASAIETIINALEHKNG